MKKITALVLCVALIAALAGCGKSGNTASQHGGGTNSVNDVLQKRLAEEDGKEATPTPTVPAGDPATPTAKPDDKPVEKGEVDIDLTKLSSSMVYAEVYNMITKPGDYIGKKVRMDGVFAMYHDEATDQYYFACIVADATACCSNGIEFVLAGEHKYPDDYPELGSDICVSGVFDTYEEAGTLYCTLRNAVKE